MNVRSTSNSVKSNGTAFKIFLIVGYAIAFFLYYIDEGNYHFEGLKRPTEWIFLSIYALFFTGCFGLAFLFLRKSNLPFFLKVFISINAGFLFLVFLMFFLFAL